MAIREGRWDCPSCGSRGIYGRHVECPGCGKPRPAGVRFYLADDAPVVTDAARLGEAAAGADWVCLHCAASNRATLQECGGCGGARGSSPAQPVIDYAAGTVPRDGDAPSMGTVVAPSAAGPSAASSASGPAPGSFVFSPPPPKPPRPPPTRAETVLGCGGLLLIALLVIGLPILWFQWQRQGDEDGVFYPAPPLPGAYVHATYILGMRWEREVAIEERSIVTGEGFSLPDSAQVIGQERAVQRYDQVLDGYTTEHSRVERGRRTVTGSRTRTRERSERVQVGTRTYACGQRDRGNGYFEDRTCEEPVYETRTRTETYDEPVSRTESDYEEVSERVPRYRSVPVYGTLYRWRAPRWTPLPPTVARGDTTAPVWPAPVLRPSQRLAGRRERYFIRVAQQNGEELELEITADEWSRHRPGQSVGINALWQYGELKLFPPDSTMPCREWRAGRWPRPDSWIGCTPPRPPADSVLRRPPAVWRRRATRPPLPGRLPADAHPPSPPPSRHGRS